MKELKSNPEKNLPPDDSTKIFFLAVKAAMELKVCLCNEIPLHALCPPLMRKLDKCQD